MFTLMVECDFSAVTLRFTTLRLSYARDLAGARPKDYSYRNGVR